MNDADRWIYFDGPEPEHLRPLLDALREARAAGHRGEGRMVPRVPSREPWE